MRGEYHLANPQACQAEELPPRARRILIINQAMVSMVGTTSACAENTPRLLRRRYHHGNYLRVRGEYGLDGDVPTVFLELPPRARRILAKDLNVPIVLGTTSACAENTVKAVKPLLRSRNYLRVRGEYLQAGA